ncbi:MFS transporter small subunit [Enteractinococcus coprophilus]|uniref:Uncharacterized protein n=1 Tax=Enteractinococcus coprophilus TaxID=1027633 RepID=A0A543AGL9_9MICC|nr:hypothetical protein [Enteractinococcus coprophilus]TQL71720.1 hypothetical protein FB556_2216 [Enteractinococcus coprophilus]
MSSSQHFLDTVTDEVTQTYRTIAVILALIVIMGLGYGLVDTAIKAAALFTE